MTFLHPLSFRLRKNIYSDIFVFRNRVFSNGLLLNIVLNMRRDTVYVCWQVVMSNWWDFRFFKYFCWEIVPFIVGKCTCRWRGCSFLFSFMCILTYRSLGQVSSSFPWGQAQYLSSRPSCHLSSTAEQGCYTYLGWVYLYSSLEYPKWTSRRLSYPFQVP